MKRYLFSALLFAALAARAEDQRIEAVRADAAAALAEVPAPNEAAPAPALQSAVATPQAPLAKEERSRLPVHFGAMLGLFSLPRPVDAEVFVRAFDLVSVGFSYSDFPAFVADPLLAAAGAKNGSTQARLDDFSAMEADLRVHPFLGGFFVGTSFGHQSLKAAVTQQTPAGPQTGTVAISTVYATPRVGWMWTFGPGFLLGFDAGVQFKLSADRRVSLPPGATPDMQKNAENLADLGASYPLPSVHLRIGWQY